MAPREALAEPDRFQEAIDAFAKRSPVTRAEWDEMTATEREYAFTVARVTEARILQDVMDAVGRAVRDGTTLQDFKDEVGVKLIEEWGGEIPGRTEVIFRTNILGAYSEGRHAQYSAPTVKAARPYLRCDVAEDDRLCDICGPFEGVIRPQEDWVNNAVPRHHQCRCILVPLSEDEAQEEGVAEEMPDVEPAEGFGTAPSEDGEDWKPDLSSLDPELAEMVAEEIAAGRKAG